MFERQIYLLFVDDDGEYRNSVAAVLDAALSARGFQWRRST
jgi:hypothetical protein